MIRFGGRGSKCWWTMMRPGLLTIVVFTISLWNRYAWAQEDARSLALKCAEAIESIASYDVTLECTRLGAAGETTPDGRKEQVRDVYAFGKGRRLEINGGATLKDWATAVAQSRSSIFLELNTGTGLEYSTCFNPGFVRSLSEWIRDPQSTFSNKGGNSNRFVLTNPLCGARFEVDVRKDRGYLPSRVEVDHYSGVEVDHGPLWIKDRLVVSQFRLENGIWVPTQAVVEFFRGQATRSFGYRYRVDTSRSRWNIALDDRLFTIESMPHPLIKKASGWYFPSSESQVAAFTEDKAVVFRRVWGPSSIALLAVSSVVVIAVLVVCWRIAFFLVAVVALCSDARTYAQQDGRSLALKCADALDGISSYDVTFHLKAIDISEGNAAEPPRLLHDDQIREVFAFGKGRRLEHLGNGPVQLMDWETATSRSPASPRAALNYGPFEYIQYLNPQIRGLVLSEWLRHTESDIKVDKNQPMRILVTNPSLFGRIVVDIRKDRGYMPGKIDISMGQPVADTMDRWTIMQYSALGENRWAPVHARFETYDLTNGVAPRGSMYFELLVDTKTARWNSALEDQLFSPDSLPNHVTKQRGWLMSIPEDQTASAQPEVVEVVRDIGAATIIGIASLIMVLAIMSTICFRVVFRTR